MPTITRIVGMHNNTPEANRDAVWAGLVIRQDDGRYQFIALNGRRLGFLRQSPQPLTYFPSANTKYTQMYREKLAHGYTVIDWTAPRYGLFSAISHLGDYSVAETIMPFGEPAVIPPTIPAPPPTRPSRITERPAAAPEPAPEAEPAPSVEALANYIATRTGAPEVEVAKPPAPEQPPIRKARRLDF